MASLPGRRGEELRRPAYEQPHDPGPQQFAVGERVRHYDSAPWPGSVVKTLDCDGLVEVDFGRHGITIVAPEDLERTAVDRRGW